MKTNYDVIVIGGGPGGSSIATLLQRKGWDVVLFEKAKFPARPRWSSRSRSCAASCG